MNLHRASRTPEWDETAPAERSAVQKIAARTHGIVTPANAVTVVGLGVVLWGLGALLQEQFVLGLLLVVGGRSMDIVDGVIAELTRTKSSVGELFDAVADKIGTVLTIVVLLQVSSSYWWLIVALIVPQLLITALVLYKKQKNIGLHPTRHGKLSMALLWVGIAGLLCMEIFDANTLVAVATYVVIGVSVVLGLYALWQYGAGRSQN